jgi:hypothetical protein
MNVQFVIKGGTPIVQLAVIKLYKKNESSNFENQKIELKLIFW